MVTWASATTSVATINGSGLATGAGVGTSTITATDGSVPGQTVLTVTPAVLQSIAVTPANPSIAKGLTQQFKATGTFSDSTTEDLTSMVTWASAATSVATINGSGLAMGAAVGTSTITATDGSVSGHTVLTVTAAALQSITVTPANPSIAKGRTEQSTATGTYSDSSTQDLTTQVTWASSAPTFATINSTGLATGVGVGTSTITATDGSVSGQTVLTVSPAVLQTLAVTPVNPSVAKGQTQQFTAMGTFSDSSIEDLTNQVAWTSGTPSVATINSTGVAATLATGTTSIGAALDGVSATTVLTVTPAILQSIAVAPVSPSVPKGETQQFTATGVFTDNTTEDLTSQVTWASITTAVATINTAGLATAVGTGTSAIAATFGSLTGRAVLTVTPAVLESISVTPANPTVPLGETEQLTATGTLSDNTTEDLTSQVTWTSATPAVATINATGLATTLTTGSSSISAAFGGFTGQTLLTVGAPALLSITVAPASPSVPKGETDPFTATGKFSDNTTEDVTSQVTWASLAPSVAMINSAGVATGVGTGTAMITATESGVTGQATLTITAAMLQSIAVAPASPSIDIGTTEAFTATGTYSDNSTQDLTSQVTWTSDSSPVATINASGVASALKAGSSSISATLGGISGGAVLTVINVSLVSIAVTPANPSVPKGETESFTATGTFSDNTKQDLTSQVTWASATPSIATINAAGVASGVATGTSTISAMLGSISGQTVLTVSPAALLSIAVTPANPSLTQGSTASFTATGTLSDNTTEDLTSQVIWTSGAGAVATIDKTGLAIGVAPGASTIRATLGGLTGQTTLTVTATPTPTPTPTPSPTPTPTPTPAPTLAGEQRLFTGKGLRRKVVGFQLSFSAALNTSTAENVGNYQVAQPGRTRHSKPTNVPVRVAQYNPASNTVTLTLGKFNTGKPLTLTAKGLMGATGTPASTIVTKL
jgi:uncharacterized protein YjdB